MPVTSYAIVGASRGIGLEYVRQLVSLVIHYCRHDTEGFRFFWPQAARPNTIIFALVRNSRTSTHLQDAVSSLNNVHVVDADVADPDSMEVSGVVARPSYMRGRTMN